MSRRVVVVGAGVTGSAVAAELAGVRDVQVTLVERGPADRLVGSTGHAPGFVGVLGESPVLTGLARLSTDVYEGLHAHGKPGFDRVGGLEVARSAGGWAQLERRAALAEQAALPHRLLDPEQTVRAAPDLVDPDGCTGGLWFERDGTARARVVTAALRQRATSTGVRVLHGTAVTAVDDSGPAPLTVRTSAGDLPADDVVLAAGLWGRQVAAMAGVHLPMVPVAHPYVHGPVRPAAARRSPFVRWPEHHVYARDHGDRAGLGSYDHAPVRAPLEDLGTGAELPWTADFEGVVERASRLLPSAQRFTVQTRLNGVFAMTPDNQPLLGPAAGVPGLWIAQALWVTHAAGAARCLVSAMTGGAPPVPGLASLLPDRFAGQPDDRLEEQALRLYRDIYATG